MNAIVKIAGNQYIVSPDQELLVARVGEAGSSLEITEVLAIIDGANTLIGQPFVSGARVTAEVVSAVKGPKIRVAKFKAKSRYNKVRGFRSQLTKIKISSISLAGSKSESAPAPVAAKPKTSARKPVKKQVDNREKK